ncbi:mitochondrial ribosomal protein L27 isoform X2 [Oratosquilla oratoria]|uniref:mitochondrial ribosomal protein L27 isoform X2 n=1 Tax=Oratosquilla oratoria TaxID=337810 RepID=UPI003F76F968
MALISSCSLKSLATSYLPLLQRNADVLPGAFTCVRHASKKSGGSSKNIAGRAKGKARGMKKLDGQWASEGSILVRQLGLIWHPGLNVGIGSDRTLYAKTHGTVVITTEKVNPNWDHKFMKRFYGYRQDQEDVPFFKNYFHIIPDKSPVVFKLVEQI